jgi:predicted nucleic acid-binding protein
VAKALETVDELLESPTLAVLHETVGYWQLLRELVADGRAAGPRVHDARVAAVCLANGVTELWTADRDFGRFPELRVRNPLVAS